METLCHPRSGLRNNQQMSSDIGRFSIFGRKGMERKNNCKETFQGNLFLNVKKSDIGTQWNNEVL